jgi:hypothetical protein
MPTSVQAYLSLYTQILRILIISVASVVIISSILNIPLKAFFSSLGAAAALLTFLFKDSITGLLARYLVPEAINKVSLEHIGRDITNIKIFRLYILDYI